ncbi:MAG: DUF4339 domain-containing protein [Deltaproteobacteria bacterium]|nr:DUF4339 domain-containing protein [Deltaproteobacteria bacterium]MBI3294879.1 DUF4339 domain-containing protein [Deltaproteobacteria bacterium]
MGQPGQQLRQYFLGIGGQQTGPFSEDDILSQWRSGKITDDALVWFEGLDDWKPAGEILRDIATGSSHATKVTTEPAPLNFTRKKGDDSFSTFATKEEGLNPVFDDTDAGGGTGNFFLRFRLHFFLGTFIVVGFLGAAGFYLFTMLMGPKEALPTDPIPQAAGKKLDRRDLEYRKAVGEILLNSDQSLATFVKLVKENSNDQVGKLALDSAVDYYRRSQRYSDIGRILISANRPTEAVQYFKGEQPSYPDALNALELSFQQTKKPEYLLQQVELLLGPLNNSTKAIELVRKFETTFPGVPHPFAYYLKSPDEQVADLFARISRYFVDSLVSFIETELPQVHMPQRPLVELKRDKDGNYRVVGTYNGDVTLSRDILKNIRFVFWLTEDRWTLVETNFTKERARYSEIEKNKLLKETLTTPQMLVSLETRFKTQFPKSRLHEAVKPADASTKALDE